MPGSTAASGASGLIRRIAGPGKRQARLGDPAEAKVGMHPDHWDGESTLARGGGAGLDTKGLVGAGLFLLLAAGALVAAVLTVL